MTEIRKRGIGEKYKETNKYETVIHECNQAQNSRDRTRANSYADTY